MKIKLLLCLCLFVNIGLRAQVAGPDNPNSFSNGLVSGYSQQWIDINNVNAEDEFFASFGNLPEITDSHTDYLLTQDFGFTIPAGTIITGIKVEVKCSDPNSRTSDYSVRIVKTGSITGDEKATGTNYPSDNDYMVYGGSTDLWGETWDYKFIDDNHFGVAIAAQRNKNDGISTDGQVDNIKITVYYTFITLPVSLTSFTATMQNKVVQINWQTSSENDIISYQVERSADGRNFDAIASMQSLNLSGARYNYTDNTPLSSVSYYRLNIVGVGGYQKYSQIVSVKNNQENYISLFPNPLQKGEDLNISNNNNEYLTVYFFNARGQILATAKTDTKIVPAATLANRTGLIYYKILNNQEIVVGKGRLLIN
jgi:hypothetical protein